VTYLKGSPQEERRVQTILLDELDAKFERAIATEIERASAEMVEAFSATGSAPNLPDDYVSRLTEMWVHMAAASIGAFGSRVIMQGKSLGLVLEVKEDFAELFARLVGEYIANEVIRRRITSVAETTRKHIIAAIDRGQSEGKGVDEIAKAIMEVLPSASRIRAHTIARTETHGAANFGANEAAKATGLKLKKEWVSVHDHRTRSFQETNGRVDEYDHRSMDGQTVDMDQPFKMPHISGQPINAMFPGDPALPAAASINCRCAVAHIVDDGF
jgi:uncharacterized protein with gpF-like domain